MKKEYIITHPSQLNSLSVLPLVRTKGLGILRLSGNMNLISQKDELEQQLNKHYNACGCDTGAKGLIVGIILAGAFLFLNYLKFDYSVLKLATIALTTVIISTGIGKLYGLSKANKRLKSTINEIKKVWIPEKGFKEEKNICG